MPGMGRLEPRVVIVLFEVRPVVAQCERRPVMAAQGRIQAAGFDETGHRQQLAALVADHGGDERLKRAEASRAVMKSHQLPDAPGGAAQRRATVERHRLLKPGVLAGAAGVTTRDWAADLRMGGIEPAARQAMEDVALE